MEASLMVSLGVMKMLTFARFPEVRSHSNHKVYYVLKYYSLALVSGKLLKYCSPDMLTSPNLYVSATNKLLSAY